MWDLISRYDSSDPLLSNSRLNKPENQDKEVLLERFDKCIGNPVWCQLHRSHLRLDVRMSDLLLDEILHKGLDTGQEETMNQPVSQ